MNKFDQWASAVIQRREIQFVINNVFTIIIVLTAFVVYAYISIFKHLNYQSNAFDLAIFTQTSWLIGNFKDPYSTIRMIWQPADHFTPTYWLLSLGYGIFNNPVYLLLAQIASIMAGAIPVWKLSKQALKSNYAADLLLIAYFLQVSLISALSFDFSTTALSVGFISWAIYFWHQQRLFPYCLMFILALGCKEDIPILFGAFSLLMLYYRQWRWFAITLGISIGWFLLVIYYILPVVFNHPSEYTSSGSILSGLASKEFSVRQIFIQNLGFALLNPIGVLFSAANLTIRFLKPGENYWLNYFHYGASIAAPLIISTALGIRWFIDKTKIHQATAAILLTFSIAVITFWTTGPLITKVAPLVVSRKNIDASLSKVPNQASISAQNGLTTHLSEREHIYLFPRTTNRCANDTMDCGKVDYIVLNKHISSWPLTNEELSESIDDLLVNEEWQLVSQDPSGTLIFKSSEPK